ncbi:MAG: galactose ABC transporter substrate-binding protein [Oscillospiraceae bacterium]|nr:galactose ABC transporter substrate-binding protein [Oscillospiraceae bacterium]
MREKTTKYCVKKTSKHLQAVVWQSLRLLCAAAVLAAAAGCGQAAPDGETRNIKIGVSIYDQYDTFIGLLTDRFLRLAREKEEALDTTITILQESAAGSQMDQNAQVEDFIQSGCDVICINIVDRTDASVIIDLAETAEIPVIFFNRELVEEDLERWSKLYYVGAMALQSGRLQGRILIDLCRSDFKKVDRNGDGLLQYVMLEGEAGHQDAIMRTQYSVSTVEAAGYRLERLGDEIANWNRAQADNKMTQFLEAHANAIEVVFSNNDEMALGTIDALHRAGVAPEDWPVVLGIDGTPAALQALQKGEMTGTVLNNALGQAQGMLDLACAVATGSPLPDDLEDGKYIRLPYETITPANVAKYIEAS